MRKLLFIVFLLTAQCLSAQIRTDKVLVMGRVAMSYEDYVLAIRYFNQVINSKPYLYEPWFYRGMAKYNLDDYEGAEADCNKAIEINPFVEGIYELRGLCKIQLKRYDEAVADYDNALNFNPDNQSVLHNRMLCRIEQKNYSLAGLEVDSLISRWGDNARYYAIKAEICFLSGDTVGGINALDRSLELDEYNGPAWSTKAQIAMSHKEWKEGNEYLTKAIHYLPKYVPLYLNRAICRYNINKLRECLEDYDMALTLDPNSFFAHYNRGLLRAQVGDNNRAITDFNFILKTEPDNLVALVNRAILLEKTGDLRGAVRDYSTVIKQYPEFWLGLQNRANCYRRLGDNAKAERDEFTLLKSQQEKHLGFNKKVRKVRETRHKSDEDIDKYNELVVADENESAILKYENERRGRIQNNPVEVTLLPDLQLDEETAVKSASALNKWEKAVICFNMGNKEASHQEYTKALRLYNEALRLDEGLAEAYYNRGLVKIFTNDREAGLKDLSTAGEKGIYIAYSVIKKYKKEDEKKQREEEKNSKK